MSKLFEPFTLRNLTFKNRIFVSPMCQYSATDGVANEWHQVHLGSRAIGGAAMILLEATGITPAGRISHGDLGLWNDTQKKAFIPITKFLSDHDCIPGIQLAHAGRKASAQLPWEGGKSLRVNQNPWQTIAPSAIPFDENWHTPKEMSKSEIDTTVLDFVAATKRALEAGFKVVELHFAHGYLIHEFLSPLSNHRTDEYGGSLENRMRFGLEVTKAVRAAWPSTLPLLVRISATDWTEGGWNENESVEFSKRLKEMGVDLIDCSTGGNVPHAKIPSTPGYQVQFAEKIKREAGIATGAVGLITEPKQAEEILSSQKADAILLGRAVLSNPYWPLHAAKLLKVDIAWTRQYLRAK